MFYLYNQITQAVSSASQEQSTAQSLTAKAANPAEIHYEYQTPKVVTAAMKQQATNAPSGYPVPNSKRYKNLMDLQSKFSLQDGKLVWQKLPKDMPLYYTTIALVTVGFGLTVYSLAKLATPPKND